MAVKSRGNDGETAGRSPNFSIINSCISEGPVLEYVCAQKQVQFVCPHRLAA
jgi:hypothetical protein